MREFSLLNWLNFILDEKRFGLEPDFTEKVMSVFSRHFGSMSIQDKTVLVSRVSKIACIVTRVGMKIPSDAYFKAVNLFPDLPTVHFVNNRNVSDVFLKALGVREHVDLQTVFDRLLDLNWDHVQLIKYLASVQEKLTDVELGRLKATPMFPKEAVEGEALTGNGRFLAKDLYAPLESSKSFGLPLLAWSGKWRTSSDEAKFMTKLGLGTHMPLGVLLEMASKSDSDKRMQLIQYFCDNYTSQYATVYRATSVRHAFLPTTTPGTLAKPGDCYSDPGSSVMGCLILVPELKLHAEKLGVNTHPSSQILVQLLKNKPPRSENSVPVFTYLSSRQYGI